MGKTKLTLYVNKEISEKAKKISKITGRSISSLVSEFICKQDINNNNLKISEKVSRWIGVAKSEESYKELRDKTYEEKLKKYEDST